MEQRTAAPAPAPFRLLVDMPLQNLPLRPSTLEAFSVAGFERVREVQDSYETGGIANLVAELYTNHHPNASSSSSLSSSTTTSLAVHAMYQELVEAATTMSSGAVAGPHQPNILERPTSAVALLQWQQQQHPSGSNNSNNNNTNKSSSIITFCRALDQVLCGGIRRGELTEIAGAPGTGKTALATQLAVTAALPGFVGGVHGSTIYIDTEGSFCPERCHTLASHLVEHIRAGLYKRRRHNRNENDDEPSNNNNHHQRGWNATADDILANIHVFRVHSVTDLTTVISGALPELVDRLATSSTSTSTSQPQPPPVRLIVIDSLAFPHRAAADPETTDFVARTRQLTATAAALSQLAVTYQTAVVAINQMTTKLFYPHPSNTNNNTSTNSNNSSSWMDSNGTTTTSNSCSQTKLVPALGESWAHAVTTRLLLTVDSNSQHSHQQELQRRCTLTKSPRMPNGSAIFTIVEAGVRGVEYKASKKHCTAAPM